MDAKTIVEKLSLELLVAGKVTPKALQPHLDALRKANLDATALRHLEAFEKHVTNAAQPRAYEASLEALERLSTYLEQNAGTHATETPAASIAKSDANLLTYDASHGQEILNSFFSEVSGHLQVVEQQLMRLEAHPGDRDALNAVFGAMHSLKGIMGFLDVKAAHELAHEAEAVMELARKREEGIEPNECDAILKTVDVLRAIEDRILNHTRKPQDPLPETPAECSTVLAALKRVAKRASDVPAEAPSTAKTQPQQDTGGGTRITDRSGLVRVKVEKLDDLIEMIGELVVTHAQIQQDSSLLMIDSRNLTRNFSQLGKITRELQSVAMSLRMHSLRDVFGRMARLARDIAHKQNKELEVIIEGEETELDKNVIEALVDPLSHLVRNAVDHGIDTPEDRAAAGKPARATLRIVARHQGGAVEISVSDDGRGLNAARIAAKAVERGLIEDAAGLPASRIQNLIFEPGFSTAERVTEISGRGVGLDVVRRNVQTLGGRVAVDTVAGQSTTFVLTLPLTLAIIDGLIVRSGAERYIVPITSVSECVQPRREHVSTVQERGEVIDMRGSILPLVRLSDFAGVTPEFDEVCKSIVMIVEASGERFGLVVDELLGQQQIVIRSLGERLKGVQGIASGAILGDGRVGLILDLEQVLRISRERQAAAV